VNVSVVIAFYNNYPLLEMILRSLSAQFDGSFDVIIADDGSRREVVDRLNASRHRYPFTISHVWQDDLGFRKNRILNRAVMQSSSEYLVFIDGDCVPQQHFIEDHREQARRGTCLCGRRVDFRLEEMRSLDLTRPEKVFRDNVWRFLILALRRKTKNVEKGFRIKGGIVERLTNRKSRGIVGCNFSLFKDDLLSINGFDERYEGPGFGEDSDIEFRLRRQGVEMRSLIFRANLVHFDAGSLPRSRANHELLAEVIRQGTPWTEYGIKKA
jgi:glycosyltransferase involved in cell wall biosynthesis